MNWKISEDDGREYLGTRNGRFVYRNAFEKVFGDADTYEDLINHENASSGWKRIFDVWRTEGILN